MGLLGDSQKDAITAQMIIWGSSVFAIVDTSNQFFGRGGYTSFRLSEGILYFFGLALAFSVFW